MTIHCAGHTSREKLIDEAITTILATVDMELVLDRIAALLRRHFGATRVTLNRLCDGSPSMAEVLLVDDPGRPTTRQGTRFSLAGTLCGVAVETRQPQMVEELDAAQPRYREERQLAEEGYGALACYPLVVEERVLGTLDIAHPPRCGLMESCYVAAGKVAELIAIALHNSQLMVEVRRLNQLLDRENAYLKDQAQQARQDRHYVAEGPLMQQVMQQLRMVAPTDSTVLIRGETGTGKEGLARLVHEWSDRSAGPFVVVNLGAIPETLMESELFGHERGAFTGASRRVVGRFEQASGGTLFLDEVGDAPQMMQVKLLRALQERQIERLGGSGPIRVNVRVVAATNQDLERMLEDGSLRMDLYYRLNTFPIQLPPLRERDDLQPLVRHLLQRHARRMHRSAPRVCDEAWRTLRDYRWPGNVRELENYLERALILSPREDLVLPELPGARGPARAAAAPSAALDQTFDQAVRELLQRALTRTDGKIYGPDGAAQLLGLKPTTLQGKLRRHGLVGVGRKA